MTTEVVAWKPIQLPVAGGGSFPVRHIWCAGRNYAEHAREMGATNAPREPVFFSKPAAAMSISSQIAYPPGTALLHHEVELVVFMQSGGRRLSRAQARKSIFGYAVGVDLTRRDVQTIAKQAGHPWEMSKGFDQSAPVGQVVSAAGWQPQGDTMIRLEIDGEVRQSAQLGDMLFDPPELIARLSQTVTVNAGDVIFTGTPAGVGPLLPGEQVRAMIDGLPALNFVVEGRP
ncbi:MAG TPA: fumarylacetoacetate hydrolase family protein [Wenzhouxiangella sp.]|nr:fumarylacetoacetate hydrolase family protein [Wenzhouxiangella sp.]